MTAPIARIILRWGLGAFIGWESGELLAGDTDVVQVTTVAVTFVAGAGVELWYWVAKRYGWNR